MNIAEAKEKIERAITMKMEDDNRRAWEAFDLQNKIVKEIGLAAYASLYGGYYGTPGPVGTFSLEKIEQAAAALVGEIKDAKS